MLSYDWLPRDLEGGWRGGGVPRLLVYDPGGFLMSIAD